MQRSIGQTERQTEPIMHLHVVVVHCPGRVESMASHTRGHVLLDRLINKYNALESTRSG